MKDCVRMFLLSAIICGDLDVCLTTKGLGRKLLYSFYFLMIDWTKKCSLRSSGYVQGLTRNHMSSAVVPPGRRLSMSMAVCTINYQGTSHEIPFELNVRKISFSLGNLFSNLILSYDLRKERGCPNFLASFGPKCIEEFQNFQSFSS
jgi:hypothetical protein